jgi:hypothetical protein
VVAECIAEPAGPLLAEPYLPQVALFLLPEFIEGPGGYFRETEKP